MPMLKLTSAQRGEYLLAARSLLSSRSTATAATVIERCHLHTQWQRRHHMTTFSHQSALPRLPIPPLHETVARYLKSLEPLTTKQELAHSTRAAQDFVSFGGIGELLQQRLLELDRREPNNWLEKIWLNKAYLEWREPNYINVNWLAAFCNHPHLGVDAAARPGAITDIQLERAAGLISHMLDTNDKLNSGQMECDIQRGTPLCMNQFKYQFGTTRVPKKGCDTIIHQYPCHAKHIIVSYRDQLFSVPVYDVHGQRMSPGTIKQQLQELMATTSQLSEPEPPIGVLTTENRDTWAEVRSHLEANPANKHNLEAIDSSLFMLCLDDAGVDSSMIHDKDKLANHLLHAGNGRNRWYDKSFQVIVLNTGQAGCNGEHSPVDALTTGRICMDAILAEETPEYASPFVTAKSGSNVEKPKLLRWSVDSRVRQAIEVAEVQAVRMAQSIHLRLGEVAGLGSDYIKKAKVSPDAFVQMALQLAYYRLHGQPCATYETASTRAFLHGRTETIRSCSSESLAFTKAFDDPDVPARKKAELLARAVAAHLEYMKAASQGKGVDRHLLGLRTQLQSDEERARAQLLSDPAFSRSCDFKMSTSNVSAGCYFRGGFAPVSHDGYGINYGIDKDNISFSISQWDGSKQTNAEQMHQLLSKSLLDLRDLAEYTLSRVS